MMEAPMVVPTESIEAEDAMKEDLGLQFYLEILPRVDHSFPHLF
jgi:hypothetical protein